VNHIAWLIALSLVAAGCRQVEPAEIEDANGLTVQDRNDIQIKYAKAGLDLKELMQVRGEVSAEGQRRARRDQLFVMTTGLEEGEALDLLIIVAERWPKAAERQWLWAAYGWLGRDGRQAKWNMEKFLRSFCYYSQEIEDASVYWEPTSGKRRLILRGMKASEEYQNYQFIRHVALSAWQEEATLGLIDSPPANSSSKGWLPGAEFRKVFEAGSKEGPKPWTGAFR
jgi:hypothetical protein